MSKEKQRYKTTVTPGMASGWLSDNDQKMAALNLKQRPIKRVDVDALKEKILTGNFSWGINSISLASNLAVLNGQHTLLAVVETGMSITIDVWYDVPREDFAKFDSSVSARTLPQILAIQQESEPQLKSQLVPIILAYNSGTLSSFKKTATAAEMVLKCLEDERDDIEAAIEFAKDADYKPAVVAFMHYAYSRKGLLTKDVNAFLLGFASGANLRPGSTALRFRTYVQEQGRDLRERKMYGVFFKVLNRVLSGEPIQNFGALSKRQPLMPISA